MLRMLEVLPPRLIRSIKKHLGIKLTSPLIFLLLLIPNSSAYEVEPVWNPLEYNQGDYAQFIIHGNKNQTNISCTVRYYYNPNPLSLINNTSLMATEFHGVNPLNESGVGIFEVRLIKENGFGYIGFYNLTFRFGNDLFNETGFELWTAPRTYVHIKVRMNEQMLLEDFNAKGEEISETVTTGMKHVDQKASDLYLVVMIFILLGGIFVFNWLWEKKYYETFITSFLKIVVGKYNKYKTPTGNLDRILNPMTSTDSFRRIWRDLNDQIGDSEQAVMRKRQEIDRMKERLKQNHKDEEFLRGNILMANPNDPHLKSPIVIFRDKNGEINSVKLGKLKKIRVPRESGSDAGS